MIRNTVSGVSKKVFPCRLSKNNELRLVSSHFRKSVSGSFEKFPDFHVTRGNVWKLEMYFITY